MTSRIEEIHKDLSKGSGLTPTLLETGSRVLPEVSLKASQGIGLKGRIEIGFRRMLASTIKGQASIGTLRETATQEAGTDSNVV